MAKQDLLKFGTVKDYISENLEGRSRDDGVELLINRVNEILRATLKEAMKKASKEDLDTIMKRHMEAAVEENLGEKLMDPEDLFEQIKPQKATALSKLNTLIENHIKKLTGSNE